MGFFKENRVVRGVKTILFLITMFVSFLVFSAPILLIIADTLIPSALLSASVSPQPLYTHLSNYDFRYSLIDIPIVSIIRSAIILCVYSLCDRPGISRGPYFAMATICSVSSLIFVSLKASYVFSSLNYNYGDAYGRAMEIALFLSSWILAIGHIVVAYRISCRERRKLLVYKIDIEAVSLMQEWVSKVSKSSARRKSEVKSLT